MAIFLGQSVSHTVSSCHRGRTFPHSCFRRAASLACPIRHDVIQRLMHLAHAAGRQTGIGFTFLCSKVRDAARVVRRRNDEIEMSSALSQLLEEILKGLAPIAGDLLAVFHGLRRRAFLRDLEIGRRGSYLITNRYLGGACVLFSVP
jgi:hypothetical protein